MNPKINLNRIQKNLFNDTSFTLLMQKRISRVLLVCSEYDAFMLEEDGRINERLFNEYVSLNLRYPPQFIHAPNETQALEILQHEHIDLVITMLSVDPFEMAKKIKQQFPLKPIVVLTTFSREVSQKLAKEDLSAIDYVFSWLGNTDLLIAITKLIEDKMNLKADVEELGVQVILLVEDSIRYYSSYLSVLYKLILKQAKDFMMEGVNEHQKMVRMRGRPKVLLATSYEEAVKIYERYKNNLLGVISDISFSKDGARDMHAGIKLCEKVKSEDFQLPFLLQSSDLENKQLADAMNVGFIHKYSKTLNLELKNFISEYLAFGDFVFRDPITGREIERASDLQSLQSKIYEIPESCLQYHIQRNHFSKWLNARAYFTLAGIFKQLTPEDFSNLGEVRQFIYESISAFRVNKGRGIIAEFSSENFDEYLLFSRIGQGSLGGKARGLAFIDSLIKKNRLYDKYENVIITIPRTVVLTTDIFDEFMESNNLYQVALSDRNDEEIVSFFTKAKLPEWVSSDLDALISVVKKPLAIRSSSLLEDSHYQPFAGIYSTYMIPYSSNRVQMLDQICMAIKCVYASVYFRNSKAYMTATSNLIDEEKMSIVIQEVCGKDYGTRFYPAISGVARSHNFYPIAPEKSEDGVVNIAFGLGKYIVDGGVTMRFSPQFPKKVIQLSNPDMALRETQKVFYALDLDPASFKPVTDESVNLLKVSVRDAEEDGSLRLVASTYDLQNHMIKEGVNHEGKRLITFSKILNYGTFPLADILKDLLQICKTEMNIPVEIEFAADLDTAPGQPRIFNFLQVRPVVDNKEPVTIKADEFDHDNAIVISEMSLGNGVINDIYDMVYVKPESFDAAKTKEIALMIEEINNGFLNTKQNYILAGPGRWGSSDSWLGIPVKWPQISGARLIIESGLDNYRIDPSQGTHFFQNLTSFGVGYFTINPYINDGFYDVDFLNSQPAVFENEYVRHVKFKKQITIKIDGKNNKGIVLKPE